jgi:heme/copper-type cytochrome/quinol oxidase subunit 1
MATQEITIPADGALGSSFFDRLHDLVDHRRSQEAGPDVHRNGSWFLCSRRADGGRDSLAACDPDNTLLEPDVFNRFFTMHGTSMVFLVGMPIIAGLGNYLVPLMIGTRDMAFPRLNAFGYWMFLFGGLLLYFSYSGAPGLAGHGSAPDVGWFAYAPLTGRAFSRGTSTDYWILSLLLTSLGSTVSAINVIATTIALRCPGMTLMRMPLLVWLMLVTNFMICWHCLGFRGANHAAD